MRIASSNLYDRSIELMQDRQREMQASQERLIGGRRVARASDDPTAAARVERALSNDLRLQASQRALEASRGVMLQAESSMGEAGELLQRARELVLEAGNATYSDAERRILSDRLRGVRDDMMRVANRGDGAGCYLFGGQGADQVPFVDATGGVQFRSASGQVVTHAGEPLPMTVDGERTFLRAPTGNGVFATDAASTNGRGAYIDSGRVVDPGALTGARYSIVFSTASGSPTYEVLKEGVALPGGPHAFRSGGAIDFDGMTMSVIGTPSDGDTFTVEPSTPSLSIFDTLDRLAQELGTPGRSGAQVSQTTMWGLTSLDSSMNNMLAVRAQLGTVLERTDSAEQRLADLRVQAQTEKSSAQDLDITQAVSEFQMRQTGYDAALRAYSMVQRLSLFDYLR